MFFGMLFVCVFFLNSCLGSITLFASGKYLIEKSVDFL